MTLNGKRMLWVDDDYYRLRGLVRPLVKMGLEVIYVENEKEAIKLLNEKSHFDIFLIDILIPEGLDVNQLESIEIKNNVGLLLVEKIRQIYKLSSPIFVLTVVQDKRILDLLRKHGVSNIMAKGHIYPADLKNEVALALGIKSTSTK